MNRYFRNSLLITAMLFLSIGASACSQGKKTNPVKSSEEGTAVQVFTLKRQMFQSVQRLPAELLPYESVDIFPKVEGFIQNVYVDRGSFVHKGQRLAVLIAPELKARILEASSQIQAAQAQMNEAKAQYSADKAVHERIAYAAKTPGAISKNELETSYLTMKASSSRVQALQKTVQTAQHALAALKDINNYLIITSPIDGVVTTRNLHPGALVGPSGAGANEPIFRIDQLSHLRVVLPVPERYYTSIKIGDIFKFKVPAYPDILFTGVVKRPSYAVEQKYRTEYVELDYYNKDHTLTPGMFAEVFWRIHRQSPSFVVPVSAIAKTSEQFFVIRVKNHIAHWVKIQRGFTEGQQVEVFGHLFEGDILVDRATDEIEDGSSVSIRWY